MRKLLAVLALCLTACTSTEPKTIVGHYELASLNGSPLPYHMSGGGTLVRYSLWIDDLTTFHEHVITSDGSQQYAFDDEGTLTVVGPNVTLHYSDDPLDDVQATYADGELTVNQPDGPNTLILRFDRQ
jgi:hypothetical protein